MTNQKKNKKRTKLNKRDLKIIENEFLSYFNNHQLKACDKLLTEKDEKNLLADVFCIEHYNKVLEILGKKVGKKAFNKMVREISQKQRLLNDAEILVKTIKENVSKRLQEKPVTDKVVHEPSKNVDKSWIQRIWEKFSKIIKGKR